MATSGRPFSGELACGAPTPAAAAGRQHYPGQTFRFPFLTLIQLGINHRSFIIDRRTTAWGARRCMT